MSNIDVRTYVTSLRCYTVMRIKFIVIVIKTGSDSSTAERSALGVSVTGPRR